MEPLQLLIAGDICTTAHGFVTDHLLKASLNDCLVGQVVKASASKAVDLGFNFCLRHGDFYGCLAL